MRSLDAARRKVAEMRRKVEARPLCPVVQSMLEGGPEPVCEACDKGTCRRLHILIVTLGRPWDAPDATMPALATGMDTVEPKSLPAPVTPLVPPLVLDGSEASQSHQDARSASTMPEPHPDAPRAPPLAYGDDSAPAAEQVIELSPTFRPRILPAPPNPDGSPGFRIDLFSTDGLTAAARAVCPDCRHLGGAHVGGNIVGRCTVMACRCHGRPFYPTRPEDQR